MTKLAKKTVKDTNTFTLAEAGLMLALAVGLNNIVFYALPQGGSISLFGYLPLFLFSIRNGLKKGVVLCCVYGLLDFIMKPYFVNVAQFFIDYLLAYGSLGLSGIACCFNRKFTNLQKMRINLVNIIFCLIAGSVRILLAVVSGVLFFAAGKPFWPALCYSFAYNFSYGLGNTLLAIVGLVFLQRFVNDKVA